MKKYFITIEGCAGTGKSELRKRLVNFFKKKGYGVFNENCFSSNRCENFLQELIYRNKLTPEKKIDILWANFILYYDFFEKMLEKDFEIKIIEKYYHHFIAICDFDYKEFKLRFKNSLIHEPDLVIYLEPDYETNYSSLINKRNINFTETDFHFLPNASDYLRRFYRGQLQPHEIKESFINYQKKTDHNFRKIFKECDIDALYLDNDKKKIKDLTMIPQLDNILDKLKECQYE